MTLNDVQTLGKTVKHCTVLLIDSQTESTTKIRLLYLFMVERSALYFTFLLLNDPLYWWMLFCLQGFQKPSTICCAERQKQKEAEKHGESSERWFIKNNSAVIR